MACSVTQFGPTGFILYHGGNPECSSQLLQTINEAAVGSRNRVESVLSQQSMAQ